ncbi:MAG: Appr-p processing domain protein [Candidatus Solibacter sp.]|jgi:O-acetyl-ADP-ribose deacetylase (regulator of RNase III)|nr:Appr-p processing domain protein [Candidatus Solibacter sp.]
MEYASGTGKKIVLMQGDITKIPVDAMANAANSALAGGGGVDGAIHRAGGPAIMRELDAIRAKSGGCPTGSAVATGAGNLPARYVFHAVGPVWHGGKRGEPELLAACYRKCLELAREHGVRTISFPAISTGVYGYPQKEAAEIAIREAKKHLDDPSTPVEQVVFVLFDRAADEIYRSLLQSTSGQ